VVGFSLLLIAVPRDARALPAFARRFNLACGACHSAVPRLNAFGERFHENGFKPPGTMEPPLPATWKEAIKDTMAVWTRGEFFERSEFGTSPTSRQGFAVPEHASVYVAGPLTASTSVFLELENTVHETDINKHGDFVNSDTGGAQKAFLMVDLPMLFGLHGGHSMAHMDHMTMDPDHPMDMEMGGMAAMGDGLVGHGPMVMIGRVDPSTNFSYPVDRQLFHDVPADTSEAVGSGKTAAGGMVLRFALNPYAFGAKFFGIFKRGDHTLLPTEPALYHTESAPGVDFHGRLFASKVLYQFGFTSDAAPEFTDRFHTFVPYTMLRYDFGDQDGLNGSVSILGNYGRNAYKVFYLKPTPLPPILPGTVSPRHTPPPPPGRGFVNGEQDLDVWREGIGGNLRRGPWDMYTAYMYDQVFDVPDRLAGRFERKAQGLTAEVDYRLTHSLVPSLRYDWMKAGGFKSDVIFEPGPRQSQVLSMQMRWYVFEGDNLAKVPAPALLAVSLRDSVNLTPGGSHPFGAWRNSMFLGFDLAF